MMGNSVSPRPNARRVGVELRRSRRRFDAWWLLAVLTCLGLIAIITGAWRAHLTQNEWSDELWLEVAKAGVQVVAVGVLGGGLASVWRNITARRDRKLERDEKIRAELVSLVGLYNGVKSVRRTLRSLGLDLKTYPMDEREAARRSALLSKEQADGFHAQMLVLNTLQLDYESKVKQFGQTNFLDEDTEQVVNNLGRVENHLNLVLDLWEQHGWTIREGTPLALVSDGLLPLFRVRDYMRPQVSDPLREITQLINKHMFGEASPRTRSALERVLSEHEKREPVQVADR